MFDIANTVFKWLITVTFGWLDISYATMVKLPANRWRGGWVRGRRKGKNVYGSAFGKWRGDGWGNFVLGLREHEKTIAYLTIIERERSVIY